MSTLPPSRILRLNTVVERAGLSEPSFLGKARRKTLLAKFASGIVERAGKKPVPATGANSAVLRNETEGPTPVISDNIFFLAVRASHHGNARHLQRFCVAMSGASPTRR